MHLMWFFSMGGKAIFCDLFFLNLIGFLQELWIQSRMTSRMSYWMIIRGSGSCRIICQRSQIPSGQGGGFNVMKVAHLYASRSIDRSSITTRVHPVNVFDRRLDGVDVKGYFHWTFMDDWEWLSGFTTCYGLYHVDFADPELPRKPKLSAQWLSTFLQSWNSRAQKKPWPLCIICPNNTHSKKERSRGAREYPYVK
jgi:hypothetical protein